jgi:PAS domain S-box-containing protein
MTVSGPAHKSNDTKVQIIDIPLHGTAVPARTHSGEDARAGYRWGPLLDGLPYLLCRLDGKGRVLRTNRALASWRPRAADTAPGASVHEILHPGCREYRCLLKSKWAELWRQSFDRAVVECNYHDEVMGRDLHYLLCRSAAAHHGDGGSRPGAAVLVIQDISRRKRADRMLADYTGELERLLQLRTEQLVRAEARLEAAASQNRDDRQALRDVEKKYTCLMESSLTGFYILQEQRIVDCNMRFAELFGYNREEVCRLDAPCLFPPGTADGASGEQRIVRGVTRDGQELWLHRSQIQVDCLGEAELTLGNVVDVTSQRNAEQTLNCLLCEKKILSEQLLQAQETERKLISAELHDSIGQSISAIKFGIENTLHEYGERLPVHAMQSLEAAVGKLRDTVEEVRRISMDLRPPMLDDLGLLVTMGWFCREFGALFPQLDVALRTSVEEQEIPGALKVVIFRILQEALNNIGKHALAGRVNVELIRIHDTITFSVADDGRGFTTGDAECHRGFGLGSMRERAKLSGGELAVESAPGTGTYVLARWPVGP